MFFSSKNSVFVTIARECYCPGEIVEGAVSVDLQSRIRASGISIKVTGREKCSLKDSTGNPQRGYVNMFKLVRDVVTLDPDRDSYGEFQFPFKFRLPKNVPGTSTYTEDDATAGSIAYKVKGRVNVQGGDAIKFTRHIFVVQPNSIARLVARNDPTARFCMCIKRNNILVEIATDKTEYRTGENLIIRAAIRNETQSELKGLNAELIMSVLLVSSNGHRVESEQTISSANFPPIAPLQQIPYCELHLAIPQDVPQQSLGRSVRVIYFARVSVVDGSPNLVTRIPVAIYRNESHSHESAADLPSGFNPTVYNAPQLPVPVSIVPPPPSFPMFIFSRIQPISNSCPGPRVLFGKDGHPIPPTYPSGQPIVLPTGFGYKIKSVMTKPVKVPDHPMPSASADVETVEHTAKEVKESHELAAQSLHTEAKSASDHVNAVAHDSVQATQSGVHSVTHSTTSPAKKSPKSLNMDDVKKYVPVIKGAVAFGQSIFKASKGGDSPKQQPFGLPDMYGYVDPSLQPPPAEESNGITMDALKEAGMAGYQAYSEAAKDESNMTTEQLLAKKKKEVAELEAKQAQASGHT